jgi:catechol 2,3-dioxygenase-like lactoylglutathione lyase family enzyme
MMRVLPALFTLLMGGAAFAATPSRPPITGISHIAVFAADMKAADDYYTRIMGARKVANPEDPQGVRYEFSPQQYVEVLPLTTEAGISRLSHLAWNTRDAAALRAYLVARGKKDVTALKRDGTGIWFETRDPEGNRVQFVQPAGSDTTPAPGAISGRMIHVGMMVRDRAKQDGFYRDLLGFRPYWYGAAHDGATDWISQQVPDGRDWLEYMMVGPGSTTPLTKIDQRQLGVLNHFSLGVPNMEAAVTTMIVGERLSPRHDGPQMGLDGKWQANFYDPDGTRAEFMEFKPVAKPCCSAFTAESPDR